jgi:hypothetical protein
MAGKQLAAAAMLRAVGANRPSPVSPLRLGWTFIKSSVLACYRTNAGSTSSQCGRSTGH